MGDRGTDNKKYEQVKKTLRALLLSSKGGCSPRSLVDDYRYLYGESIPYHELGFYSLMELVHSMKDVVRVQYQGSGGTRLYGVADDSTRHIAGMVARQKCGKKGRMVNMPSHPTVSMITKRGVSWAAKEGPLPKAPLAFQAQLKTLFLSYPNGIALHDFSEAFARRFGYYFSYRGWGFTSLENVLRSIPEVITVEMDSARCCQVVKLVKSSSIKEGMGEGVRQPSLESINSQKLVMSESVEVPKTTSESLNSLEFSPRKKTTPTTTPTATTAVSCDNEPRNRKRITVPKKIVGQVETILRAFPAGIWISRFPVEFKKYFDEDLPVSTLGFASVVHMLTSTPVCEVERPTGMGDWLVFRKGGPRPKVADNHQFLHEAYVSDKLIKDIHKLLRLHKKGIPLDKFVPEFEEVTKCELPVEELGFNSITELLQRVPGIDVSKPPDSAKLMVLCTTPISDSETESSDSSERMSAKEKDAMLSDVSSLTRSRSVYARQALPSKDVRMCPVYVTHIKTPSCFCVQLIGEKTTRALEALQEDMTVFFNGKDGDAYAIKEPYVGQACCSIFNNDGYWYRSEIVSISSFDVVEVLYVDYGNSSQVPLTSIRRPKAHYLILPAQSLNCRLANLKPAGSTWSRTATQLLFQMTRDRAIVAIISAIQGNCMSVCLCDTNTERDIHINDCLCNQGLALFNADTLDDQRGFDGYQLESPNLISADEKDVRLPGDQGRVASASLSTTPQLHVPISPTATTTPPLALPQSSSTATASLLTPSAATTGTSPSSLPPAVNLPLASAPLATAPLATAPLAGVLPSLQMSNSQLAQLQMQNYLQLLLLQQNALLSSGAMPIMGLQGIANPLIGQVGGGQAGDTSQTGLTTSRTSCPPPGFVPPGLTQSAAGGAGQQVPFSMAATMGNDQTTTSQPGQTTKELPVASAKIAAASVNSVDPSSSGQTSQPSPTDIVHEAVAHPSAPTVAREPSTTTITAINSNQPTSSSTHLVPSSTHPVTSSTHSPEPTAVVPSGESTRDGLTNGWSLRDHSSSSSVNSDNSSSVSSEAESPRLSHKSSRHRNSCLADSESEMTKGKSKNVSLPGESQLFYSGGAVTAAWAKEKAFVKRVWLTKDHSLCILRHDDKAYFLSSEVSEWFWESDLLQSMLRQVQKPCWGLIMTEKKNKKLFQTLRRVHFTSRFILGRQQVTVYAFEDLPRIVVTFSGPADLCTAVSEQVEAWQLLGLSYFTPISTDEIQLLEDTLTRLKEERKKLVELMMSEEDDGQTGEDSSLSQLIDVRKKISDVGKRLSKLKRLTATIPPGSDKCPGASEQTSTKQPSCEPSVADEVATAPSKLGESSTHTVCVVDATAQLEGHITIPTVSQRDSSIPAKVEGHATSPPDTNHSQASGGSTDTVSEVKGHDEVSTPLHTKESGEVKAPTSELSDLQNTQSKGLQPGPSSAHVPGSSGDVDSKLVMGERTEDMNGEKIEDPLQALGEEVPFKEGFEWDTISDPGDGVVEEETFTEMVPAEGHERDHIAVPPTVSKSYSFITSSPPRRSFHGQRAYDPEYYPMQCRVNSLPPTHSTLFHDNPLGVGPSLLPTPHQAYAYHQHPIPLTNPMKRHTNFIPIPSSSGQQHSMLHQWPPLGSSCTTAFHFPSPPKEWSRSPPKPSQDCPGISGSRSPPKSSQTTLTYAALVSSPPKSSTVAATLPNSTMSQPGCPPKTPAVDPLMPVPTSTSAQFDRSLEGDAHSHTSSVPVLTQLDKNSSSKGDSQMSVTSSQPTAPPKMAASNVAVVGGIGQPIKKRPVGIGRGGRPLPLLDNRPGRYPPVRPFVPPQYLQLPRYNVVPRHMPSRQTLLPTPRYPPLATPTAPPIPIAPEERWIYMTHRHHYGCGGKYDDFPPMGSGAGLDII